MHSTGSIWALVVSITRPSRSASAATACAEGGRSARAVETRWPGTTSDSSANQKADIAVRTRPLCGIGSAMTTSNAEMRSLVTISSRSSPTA